MLDEGVIQDREGKSYKCNNCLIICTTNLGSDWITQVGTSKPYQQELEEFTTLLPHFSKALGISGLQGNISPEFVGRTSVVLYRPLSFEVFKHLIVEEVRAQNDMLRSSGANYKFEIEDADAESLAKHLSAKSSGVRGARRYLEQNFFSRVPPKDDKFYTCKVSF